MSEISRIGTLAIYNNAINNSNRSKVNLANLQDQLSSGLKGRDFEAYNGQVEQLVGLEKEVKRVQMYLDNNAETSTRLTAVEKGLDQAYLVAEDAKKLFTLRNNPAFAGNPTFEIQMKAAIQNMAKELNANIAGRYLFGGTTTDTPPVIDNPVPTSFVIGVADDGYYKGSKQNVVTRVQDGFDLEYDVRADDPAFQKYFAALSLGLEGHAQNNTEKLTKAQNMMDSSIKEINALASRVQTKRANVDNIITKQKDTKLYFTSVAGEITSADTVAVASKVAIDQATLTATFQIFSRISSLNLADFLR